MRNLGWLRWEVVGLWWGFNEGVCWDSSNRKAWLGGRIHFQACAWQLARGLLSCLAVLWRPQFLNCGLPQDCSWYGGWLPPELIIGKREKQPPRQKLQYFSQLNFRSDKPSLLSTGHSDQLWYTVGGDYEKGVNKRRWASLWPSWRLAVTPKLEHYREPASIFCLFILPALPPTPPRSNTERKSVVFFPSSLI